MKKSTSLVVSSNIENRIYLIRGQRVMLGPDLAELYGVEYRSLVQAVKRNIERFPSDFMFSLNNDDLASLKSQFVISNSVTTRNMGNLTELTDIISKSGAMKGRGGARHHPYAFTEQGVAMLSSVLRSKRAIAVNIEIMRAFVNLKKEIMANAELSKRLDELESKYDSNFKTVFAAIRNLLTPEVRGRRKIGFHLGKAGKD